jgi:hypothetical protein
MGDWYRQKPNNVWTKGRKQNKTLTKIQIEAQLVKELQDRIAKGELDQVNINKLIDFLKDRMPKETIGTVDHNINYITNTPRPTTIDITPKPIQPKPLDNGCNNGVTHDDWI